LNFCDFLTCNSSNQSKIIASVTILLLAVSLSPQHATAAAADTGQASSAAAAAVAAEAAGLIAGARTTTEFTPTQFHIQTDTGDNRFFKYQTWNGSFRKEVTLKDGSIVGSYGWVDALGILRITEYISDDQGYRITNTQSIDVGKQTPGSSVAPLATTPVPPLAEEESTQAPPTKPPTKPASDPPEITNEIDDQLSFMPILRPYENQVVPVRPYEKQVVPAFVPVAAPAPQNPFFMVRPAVPGVRPFGPRLPHSVIRQLPVRKRRRLRQKFGVKSRPIQTSSNVVDLSSSGAAESRSLPDLKDSFPINNKDDFLILPHSPRRAKKIDARTAVPLRRRFLQKNGEVSARISDGRGRRRGVVIKRRRQKSRGLPATDDVTTNDVTAKTSVNYQTSKTFHREVEDENGARTGEYGYIDPIGVRRVVTYSTGARGSAQAGITKQKENDYVGTNTYFDAI